ncbi:Uncharacterised protein [Bacteroides uniformis]|uniref:Uncharacterized protein n=1 Tax=Bacteroides uniformis TaxID=820 RepID=A0A174VAD5_BACUN|nr:Uncharacterised protein [Bacteroides uniformis]
MIVRSYSRNKPCIRPEHIIRLSSTHHLSALNISSETSELFIRNIRTFRQNIRAFRQNRRDFPSKCLPFRLLKWRIKSVKHRFRRVNPKLWLMKWRKKTTKKEKRRLSFYANLKLNLN